MNHHADKLVYSAGRDDTDHERSDFGGVVEETHACPGCGTVKSRRAD
jgi:hypothetical protein